MAQNKTERRIEEPSPMLETSEGRGQQSHVKASDTPETSERLTAITEPLEDSWVRKNDESDDDDESDNVLDISHSISLRKMNYKLGVDNAIFNDNPKNQAFIALVTKIDSSVNDYIHDIEKLYNKISDKLRSNQHFRRKEEYEESIKKYIKCQKEFSREYKIDEVQIVEIVEKVQKSLGTLRVCLLEMNFELFAETEEGREIFLLEEKARKIYQETTDEVRENRDQGESLYADFLSTRNAFLPDWSIPEDGTEQEKYTKQQIHAIDRMKESLQKYVELCKQEVKRSYERSLDDEELLNKFREFLTQKDNQDKNRLSILYNLKDIKDIIKDIKSLHQNMQEAFSTDPEFQEDYYETYQEYTHLIDQLKKTASSQRGRDQNEDGTGAQEQTVLPDNLEQKHHAQETYNYASEAVLQLMDIREVLLEKSFECFAETEEGKEIAWLEEKAKEVHWGTTDQVREKVDQDNRWYADFLSSRNAFLQGWNRLKGEAKQEKYTEQEISYIDGMKKSLQRYIECYQQEVKRSYEQFLEDEALHKRLISPLNAEKQEEIRRWLQLNGLKDLKRLLEDVKYLNNSIYEEWHDNYDFQYNNVTFQEKYYEKYNECNNLINQFKKSRISENSLEIIINIICMRDFLLMKTSDALFVTTEEGREIVSREEEGIGVYQSKSAQSQAREEPHQELVLQEHESSAVEKIFATFLQNEEGKQIDGCLEEISMYSSHNEYLRKIVDEELDKFINKKKEIFGNYDTFLANTGYFKKRQMKELHNQVLIAKIKIEERIYVLFLHHDAGQETKQLEEKYRAFADTIEFLFDNIPLDLQNNLRTPAKEYNSAKTDLVRQLVSPERSERGMKRCVEKLNRSLEDQITSMKKKIWSQFRIFWYESGIKEKVVDFLLVQGEYRQGDLESYIENILNFSGEIADELYQHDVLRESLKKQFAYNIQKYVNDGLKKSEAQRLHDAQSVYDHVILLHRCMVTDGSQGS